MNKTHILTEISSDIDDVGGYYKFWVNRAVVVRLFFMRNDLLRIKVDFQNVGEQGTYEIDTGEESYAIILTAWEDRFDTLLTGYRTRIEPLKTVSH